MVFFLLLPNFNHSRGESIKPSQDEKQNSPCASVALFRAGLHPGCNLLCGTHLLTSCPCPLRPFVCLQTPVLPGGLDPSADLSCRAGSPQFQRGAGWFGAGRKGLVRVAGGFGRPCEGRGAFGVRENYCSWFHTQLSFHSTHSSLLTLS